MDAFFASVEILRRPELAGKPVIVGGAGRRGVVAAASYEARFFGVHSAMPSLRARRLCPHAVFLPGDHAHYREVSEKFMIVLNKMTPLVEPLSLDEAFLDVTAAHRLLGDGRTIATSIRNEIRDELGLSCSAGVATNKFLAKLASERAKPKPAREGPVPGPGVWVIEPGRELEFLHPLHPRAMWGVGPATMKKLDRIGVGTIGDLAALPLDVLLSTVGNASGRHLHALANGIDNRSVEPNQRAKSISQEETFQHDRHDRDDLQRDLVRMSDAVGTRLRAQMLVARTITIKVRFGDFATISRSSTISPPTAMAQEICATAQRMLDTVDISKGVRLLGVGATGLGEQQHEQLSFDDVVHDDAGDAPTRIDRQRAEEAVDEIRGRFGTDAIGPATLLKPGEGLGTRERNENPWG